MPRYFISFNDGDMVFPEEDLPTVAAEAHAVMRDAMAAGAWIIGGGFWGYSPVVVAGNGTVTEGPLAESPVHIGGFCVLEVPTREEALIWAARTAAACRCPQEVREIMHDEEQVALQRAMRA